MTIVRAVYVGEKKLVSIPFAWRLVLILSSMVFACFVFVIYHK